MSDPRTHDAPAQKPDAPRGVDSGEWLLPGVGIAIGTLTIAWIVFLVWMVAQIV
jgi:hypothetical protein